MSKEKDAFIDDIAKRVNRMPTEEDFHKGEIAEAFYENLRGGDIKGHVTQTVALYTRSVLPKLSVTQVVELSQFMHTIIETVLTYLVEDGLIKEE